MKCLQKERAVQGLQRTFRRLFNSQSNQISKALTVYYNVHKDETVLSQATQRNCLYRPRLSASKRGKVNSETLYQLVKC